MFREQRSYVVRGLVRPTQGRLVAGVCAGVAHRYDMDLTLVRLAALLLLLSGGLGLVLYLVGWLLIPADEPATPPGSGLYAVAQGNLRAAEGWLRGWSARLRGLWREREAPLRGTSSPVTRRRLAHLLIAGGAVLFLYSTGLLSWLGPLRAFGLVLVITGAAVLISGASAPRRQSDDDANR